MQTVQIGGGRETPVVSVGTLAKLMGAVTPALQTSLLRAHKFPSDGPKRSYQNATKQAVDFIVDQVPFDPRKSNLRPYEREVVTILSITPPSLPPDVVATRTVRVGRWQFAGVEISMHPDADTSGSLGRGAVKFVMSKDPLARGVGISMAALLWFHG